jgi:hypothetical protein
VEDELMNDASSAASPRSASPPLQQGACLSVFRALDDSHTAHTTTRRARSSAGCARVCRRGTKPTRPAPGPPADPRPSPGSGPFPCYFLAPGAPDAGTARSTA